MTYQTLIGSALIAFGPPIVFFVLFIARSAELTILSIGSGFFWLFSVFIASVLWYTIPPLRGTWIVTTIVAVLLGEASRFVFWMVWTRGQESLAQLSGDKMSAGTKLGEAAASGLGVGITYAFVMYAGILWEAWGPAALMSKACPSVSVFPISASLALAWSFLHTLWAVLAFHGYYERSWWRVAVPALTHLFLSMLTIFDAYVGDHSACVAAVLPPWVVIAILSFVVWRDVQSTQAIKRR